MIKRSNTFFAIFLIAVLWSVSAVAQVTSIKDIHKGKYSNQTVQPGQNIPTPYQGDMVQLYDNGPLITHPGGGFGGADASAVQTSLGMGTYGFGNQISADNTIADDVVINDEVWTIDGLTFYCYQTGSTTTSTINDARVRIWQNRPDGGGTIVWGDLTTNVLTSTSFTGIYRVLDTDLLNSQRPIMEVTVSIAPTLVLQPGEYWIEWEMGGTLASGPWQPAVTIVGMTTTGNALNSGYSPLIDVGPQGAPFKVFGTSVAAVGPGLATNPSPANAEAEVTTPNNTLSWTNPAGATDNNVYFGTDPGSMSLISGSGLETSLPVTGLAYSTQYFWRVDEIDGTGTTTGVLWSFTTEQEPCPIYELPVSADFEDIISLPPDCWSLNLVSGASMWLSAIDLGVNVSGYGNGLNSACAIFYFDVGTEDLISLEYNSTGVADPKLTFDWAYADYSGAELDEMDIYYSTDGGSTWLVLAAMYNGAPGDDNLNPFGLSDPNAYVPLDTEWSTRSIPLPPNTTNVKFTAISDFGNLLWLDNVLITGTLYEDSFENPPYAFPGQVACQNSAWTTWSGAPCGNEDATISTNYAHTGTQSALIDNVAPRDVDLVYLTGTKTSGKWYMSFWLYIPTGGAGYFNGQATFQTDWGFECYFNAGGAGLLDNGSNVAFTWQEDTWHQCLFILDLNTSTAEFWFGQSVMSQLAVWDWTRTGTIPNTLDGFDFFGATTSDQMYIDDYRFSDQALPILQLADDVGTFTIDMDYQYAPGTITPYATVKNYGTASNTFDVQMTITGGYTSTKTVPSIANGETYQVTFDGWTVSTPGTYTVDVCTQLGTDGDPTNDCQTQDVSIWDESGTWTSGANYPITTYNGTGVSYNDGTDDWLFVMGGNTSSGLLTECYKYNFTTNSWTQIASLPAGRLIHAAEAVGDYIYVFGGSDGTVYTNTVYKYDIVGNSWSTLPAVVPIDLGWARAVTYMDQYIYIAGGYDGVSADYQNTVYLFDANTETFSTASPMLNTAIGGGFGITGNTLVYAGGAYIDGITNAVMVGVINGGNPALINWTTMDNTYPGIPNKLRDRDGANLTAETQSQSIGTANAHLVDAVVWPAGAIYRTFAHTWGDDAIIMGGGTPTATYSAANPGPCYVYKPGTDTWTAQENIPVPVGAHQSGTVHDGNNWKYIIASGFGVDSTESETQIYSQTLTGGTTTSYSVNILNSWNMVSVAGTNPGGMAPNIWWPGLDGAVYKYSSGYQTVTTTAPGEGYWMKHTGATTYNYSAIQIVPHTDVAISTGWNLVGLYENSVPTGSITTNPPGLIILPVYAYTGSYVTASNIDPGYAYWVKSSGPGVITGLTPPMAKGSGEVVEYFKENWGRIVFTDATGINFTLYAVNGKVNLDNYELPPAPPEGRFDIRFSSGRIAENLNSGLQSIDLSGITYPLVVSVENINITLQDETGKVLNAELRSGQNVTINNSLEKLVVPKRRIRYTR